MRGERQRLPRGLARASAVVLIVSTLAAVPAPWLGDAAASTSIAVPLSRLIHESTAAVFATPMTATSVWEADRVVTYTDLHVDTRVAGAGDSLGEHVFVRTLGGAVGTVGQSVEGEAVFTMGRPSLVFLTPARVLGPQASTGGGSPALAPGVYAVTARAQGQFPVVQDAHGQLAIRRSSGIGAVMTASSGSGSAPELAQSALHGRTIAEATQRVTDAWVRFHDP